MRPYIILLVMTLMLSVSASVPATAMDHGGDGKKQKEMKQPMDEKMGMGMEKANMMPRQIVSTSDGGVVVAIGPMLLKYDRNLELIKETMIDIDHEAMMEKMAEECPLCREKMSEKKK